MDKYNLPDDQLAFNIVATKLTASKVGVSLQRFVNSVIIINYGSSVVTVNNAIKLFPGTVGSVVGDSIAFGGNKGELYKGSIDIAFDSQTGNDCLVIQKTYFPDFFNSNP